MLRRYPFGWQMLDLTDGSFRRCDLLAHGVPPGTARELMTHTLGLRSNREPLRCPKPVAFSYAGADEIAIRAALPEPHVLQAFYPVAIDGTWAFLYWSGGGGGPQVWHKLGNRWKAVRGGGGVGDACWMTQYAGVPAPVAHRLSLRVNGDQSAQQRELAAVDRCTAQAPKPSAAVACEKPLHSPMPAGGVDFALAPRYGPAYGGSTSTVTMNAIVVSPQTQPGCGTATR